jgi:hypothetical protein
MKRSSLVHRARGDARARLATAVVLGLGLVVGACGDEELRPCKSIPEGGCPLDRGGSCDDPACEMLYACFDGAWEEHERCGAGTESTSASVSASSSTGGCTPFAIDRTGETGGCAPDLLEPDCPADALETCAPCSLGCVDFYLCTGDGWTNVAHCSEEGDVISDQ